MYMRGKNKQTPVYIKKNKFYFSQYHIKIPILTNDFFCFFFKNIFHIFIFMSFPNVVFILINFINMDLINHSFFFRG